MKKTKQNEAKSTHQNFEKILTHNPQTLFVIGKLKIKIQFLYDRDFVLIKLVRLLSL